MYIYKEQEGFPFKDVFFSSRFVSGVLVTGVVLDINITYSLKGYLKQM